jgi:hypothetical protein
MRAVGINGSLAQSAATAVPLRRNQARGISRELGRSGMDRLAYINSCGMLRAALGYGDSS